MLSHLGAYCAHAFPARQNVRIKELANITAGWESEMYCFDAEYGAGERHREELILRIYPGDDARAKSAREFHGMSQLHKVGYPVPQVLVLERENFPFGQPFIIMERIEGRMLSPLLFGSRGEKQQELLTLFCFLSRTSWIAQKCTRRWEHFPSPSLCPDFPYLKLSMLSVPSPPTLVFRR